MPETKPSPAGLTREEIKEFPNYYYADILDFSPGCYLSNYFWAIVCVISSYFLYRGYHKHVNFYKNNLDHEENNASESTDLKQNANQPRKPKTYYSKSLCLKIGTICNALTAIVNLTSGIHHHFLYDRVKEQFYQVLFLHVFANLSQITMHACVFFSILSRVVMC